MPYRARCALVSTLSYAAGDRMTSTDATTSVPTAERCSLGFCLWNASASPCSGAVAGLALLGTFSASLSGALSAPQGREASAITFVIAASGLTFLGIGAAFWALAAGLLVRAVLPKPAS